MKVIFRCPPELKGLIPEPIPARRGLPDWLKAMPTKVDSADLGFEVETVKQCPPFVDAMSAGFLIPLAADIQVKDGTFSWDWDPPATTLTGYTRAPMAVHVADQLVETPFFEADTYAVKFINYWTVELPNGFGLLCTHPVNRADLPFRAVTGFVHADNYHNFVHFPAQWVDRDFNGVLKRGTPVAQCMPVPLENLDLVFETLEGEAADRFNETKTAVRAGAGAYRKHHRQRRSGG
ncbi:MAG: hypothetical protein AAF563_17510 [Pseudomonadota bacterium]